MKNSQNLVKATIVAGVVAIPGVAHAQSSKLNPDAQPTSAQLQILKASGLKVAAPSYIPAGFRLDEIQVNARRNSRIGGLGYLMIYRKVDRDSSQDFCFAIEATSGGIGDLPSGEKSFPVNNPTYGKTTLESGKYGAANRSTLLSSWMGSDRGPFYRFVGSEVNPALSRCRNISPPEAIKVTESIR
ncbi:hypothetical protein [Phormidesmis priestleyi]